MNAKYKLRGVNPLISLLLILAFLSIGIGTAAAANPIVSIAVSDTEVCTTDGSFDLFIEVNPNGNSVELVQANLGYDSSKVDITVGNGGKFTTFFHPGTPGTDIINVISGVNTPGITTTGNLAVLHVTPITAGPVNLALTGLVVGTATGTLTPTVIVETLTITDCGVGSDPDPDSPIVEILPTPKSVCVGDDFDINLAVNPSGNSVELVQANLGYDSSKVDITVGNGGKFTTFFHPGTSGADTINVISGVNTPGITTAGNLAVLNVHAKVADTVNLDLNSVVVGTGSGTLVPTVHDGVIVVDACTGPPTPNPEITAPADDATVDGTVAITVEEHSSSDNISYNLLEYYRDTDGDCEANDGNTWNEIVNDTADAPWGTSWTPTGNGKYILRTTTVDETNVLMGTDEICVTVDNPIPERNILLEEGWNFISILGTLDNSTPEHVLDGIAYNALYQYNASTGIWENVVEFKPGIGYIIKSVGSEDQNIVNLATKPASPAEIVLYPGWNAIGPVGDPEALPGNAEDVFYAVDSLYPTVIGEWNGAYYDQYGDNDNVAAGSNPPAYVDTTAFAVKPFKGYWMFANAGTP